MAIKNGVPEKSVPTLRDEYMSKRLEVRRQAYDRTIASLPADQRAGYTKPGSMNRKKG
jgi:hypothetical protein